jgi:tetratricopeptide (TPR) repeat protein
VAGDQAKFDKAMTYAGQLSDAGDWANAGKAFRFALAEFPNNEDAILGFGVATFNAGQPDLALRAFTQALKLNPGNLEALSYVADIQERAGQLDAAAETFLRLGNLLAADNDMESAVDYWERITRLVPNHLDAHQKLAHGMVKIGKTRQAARQFLTIAAVYQRRRNKDMARQQIEEARHLVGTQPGITLALEALDHDAPIHPNELDIAARPAKGSEEENQIPTFSEAFLEEDLFDEQDPFTLWDEGEPARKTGGLIESVRQNAMASLANVIFEDRLPEAAEAGASKDEINMLIMQAIDLQSRGETQTAVENYRRAVEAGMASPALYFNLGMLNKEIGREPEAAAMFTAAAADDRYRVAASFALGQLYFSGGKLEAALRHFIDAVKLVDMETVTAYRAPELAQYYDTLADQFLALNDTGKINQFIQTLDKFFSNPNWEKNVYEARRRMDSVVENGNVMSLAEFLETVETETVITALAITSEHMKRNLMTTASEVCLQAIQYVPSSLLLHTRLADILLKQDHTEAAITKYLAIAKVYLIRNQQDKAINVYKKILRLAPMDVTVRTKLIDLFILTDNIEEALDQYLTLANSYYQLAQIDRALEKYRDALRLAENIPNPVPWKVEILSHIGDIYNQRFDWAKAAEAFEQLHEIDPQNLRTQRQLADLYFKLRKTDRAAQVLDALLEAYQKQGQAAVSLSLLQELSATYPESIPLRKRLAEVYVINGKRDQAIAEYDALGEMQLESGLRREAAETIQTILRLNPDDPEGYRRLLAQIGSEAQAP